MHIAGFRIMDNIDRIMQEADRLGFGVSYGKYRAAYPDGSKDILTGTARESLDYDDDLRKCKICGREFFATHGNQAYCSAECSDKGRIKRQSQYDKKRHAVKVRSCKECGATITRKGARSYCSDACAKDGRRRGNAQWARDKVSGVGSTSRLIQLTCSYCGKEFETFDHKKKLCSPECASKSKSAKIRKWHEDKYKEG